MAGLGEGNKEWARAIARRAEKGEPVDRIAIEMASSVLGRTILRGGKHAARPDIKDRQANDVREEMVPL